MPASNASGWRRTVQRVAGAFRLLFRSRMAILGLFLLSLFAVMSLGAPLLTPYDPNTDIVSGSYAPPIWVNYFSEGARLSQNFVLENTPGFATPASLQLWQFQPSANSQNHLTMSYDPSVSFSSGSGSARIVLDRTSLG